MLCAACEAQQLFNYAGCFQDQNPVRDLPTQLNVTSLTPYKCFTAAWMAGYKYFGLQGGNTCWAGNTIDMTTGKNEAGCNAPCAGNTAVTCGGSMYNSVYSIAAKPYVYAGCYATTLASSLGSPSEPDDCWIKSQTSSLAFFGLRDTTCQAGATLDPTASRNENNCAGSCGGEVYKALCGSNSSIRAYQSLTGVSCAHIADGMISAACRTCAYLCPNRTLLCTLVC